MKDYHVHPDYDGYILDFDIAVLEIDPETPMEGFEFVESIKLPPPCFSSCCGVCPPGTVTLTGFGTDDSGRVSETLNQLSQDLTDNESCYVEWGGDITDRMFCVSIDKGSDSCSG